MYISHTFKTGYIQCSVTSKSYILLNAEFSRRKLHGNVNSQWKTLDVERTRDNTFLYLSHRNNKTGLSDHYPRFPHNWQNTALDEQISNYWVPSLIPDKISTSPKVSSLFLPFWSPSLLGVPVSLCSKDSIDVLRSLLILLFAPLPEFKPCPFLSPMLPTEPWGPLAVWLPLSTLGSQGDCCDWLPAPPCFPWLGSLESIWAALEGDITGGERTMASCLDFGLLKEKDNRRDTVRW